MTDNFTIYVLDAFHEDAISLLQSFTGLTIVLPNDPAKHQWKTKADGIMLRSETRLLASGIHDAAAAGRLKIIAKQGVGVDNIDVRAAKEAGIAVHNTPALNAESVAELTLALALSLSRRVTEIDRRIRRGEHLIRSQMLGLSLYQKTVGIVGMGNIGRAAAKKWIGACEANIIAYDPVADRNVWIDIPHRRVSNLEDLLRDADIVTLHVPLLDSTRKMIGAEQLAMMKQNTIVINAARGGIVDEKALLAELKRKRIWGAVLDVMETEPPTLEVYSELFELENVIVTPHVGASTIKNQSNSGKAVVRTLLGVLRGEKDVPGKLT